MVSVFSGEVARSWSFQAEGATHILQLFHDTVTGVRSAMLDFEEVPGSLGTSSVLLDSRGHTIPFSVGRVGGALEIRKTRLLAFEYRCVVDGQEVREATQGLAAQQEGEYTVSVESACYSTDGLDGSVVWYFVKAGRLSDRFHTEVHRRFRDFAELHEQVKAALKGHHLRSSLPRLPEKHAKMVVDHNDQAFVNERRRHLQTYLEQLLMVPHVSGMTCTRAFLGLMDLVRETSVLCEGPTIGVTLVPSERTDTPAVVGYVQNVQQCGRVQAGDVISKINGQPVASLSFQGVVKRIKQSPRPLVIHFVQIGASPAGSAAPADPSLAGRPFSGDDDDEVKVADEEGKAAAAPRRVPTGGAAGGEALGAGVDDGEL